MRSVRARSARGYTVVEVLIGISLLIIASSGIVALQKVTVQGNGHAREMATASQVARTWIERLRTDATLWNYSPKNGGASDISDTVWLQQVNAAPLTWFRPAINGLRSPGADIQGNDVPSVNINNAFYCTHIRLGWMFPEEAIRAEVRVVWQRSSFTGGFNNLPVCSNAQDVGAFSLVNNAPGKGPLARYNFSYVVSTIVRNKPQIQ